MNLPKLSIAARLYTIFALMAATTVALSVVAVSNSHHHAALTDDFESANAGSWNVERINGLIYGTMMEMRGVYMSADKTEAAKYAASLAKVTDQISGVIGDWQRSVRNSDALAFSNFAVRINGFQDDLYKLVAVARQSGPQAAREWANKNLPGETRAALTKDLEALSQHYSDVASQIYTQIDEGIDHTALLLTILACVAVALAIAGAAVIARSVTKPIGAITKVTTAVAAGNSAIAVPFSDRNDEVGALARSIAVFQKTMRSNEELNQTVRIDADMRARRQEKVSNEITQFSAEVEATLAELGRISDEMLAASTQLAAAADNASSKTARAEGASSEASSNVRDIASAADELSASVNEIDRQVAQSNAIATKAVNEVESTNLAVKELDEAAARIGDVVKLITDIAEQTNLLALNATIEAARAGEAGRGFAVVAGEVKALAGQTSRATEEIGAQIAGMQRATQRSIMAITGIEQTIREIGNISSAIAAAVTEQGAATQEIARGVEIAAERTVATAKEVNLMGTATQDTRASAAAVKSVADDLGKVAHRIRAQVDQFFDRLSA
ncbi:MAG TPA: HAMP domain-containing methyl-accepting chemotaxis protein [Pseudolabrys sp.]|nr:HAMP domain-containing methyl-accepting chemotaxis protein [Pseudolabrys sp.]